jgi:AraC family transcriptional regulator
MLAPTSCLIEAAIAQRQRSGSSQTIGAKLVAGGPGWRILDVLCTCGQHDLVRDEEHSHYSLAMVLGGAFEYRGRQGSARLAPGSILIGRAGDPFRCWHSFGAGDRCIAVQFEAEAFSELADSLGQRRDGKLPVALPVARSTAGLFAFAEILASSGLQGVDGFDTAARMAERILMESRFAEPMANSGTVDARRMLEIARWIDRDPGADHNVEALSRAAGLSKFHFIRSFRKAVGIPPYAFVTRARLREASKAIALTEQRIIDIAMNCGFSDLSTFNHLFKNEFGKSPLAVRADARNGRGYVMFERQQRSF